TEAWRRRLRGAREMSKRGLDSGGNSWPQSRRRVACLSAALNGRDAEFVALRQRRVRLRCGVATQAGEHALHHPAVDRADDGVLQRGVAEGTVLGDDLQRSAALLGMGREAVGGQGRGYVVERALQGPPAL